MIKTLTLTVFFASTLAITASTHANAQEASSGFTFSDSLQQAIEDFRAARSEFRSDVREALSGLTGQEAADVRATFADEHQALRTTGQELRDERRAELSEAGIEVADRPQRRDRPSRNGPGSNGPGSNGPGRNGPRG